MRCIYSDITFLNKEGLSIDTAICGKSNCTMFGIRPGAWVSKVRAEHRVSLMMAVIPNSISSIIEECLLHVRILRFDFRRNPYPAR